MRAARTVARVRIFAQPIHGIRVAVDGRLLVWGSARFASLAPAAVERLVSGHVLDSLSSSAVKRVTAPDWIYDAAPSPFDPRSAVLVTAHNEVIPVRFDAVTDEPVLGPVVSPSRPMLYSANLKWTSPDCVLVAAGTVFGEILMWKCLPLDGVAQPQPELVSVLAGHEGSIFGVHISDRLRLEDGSTVRLLASCSDDRTVRVWDITEPRGETKLRPNELSAVRETGFGATAGNSETTSPEGVEAESTVAVAMGHASRIWGIKFATGTPEDGSLPTTSSITLYSFGEDSTSQRWRLDLHLSSSTDTPNPTNRLSGMLKHQGTLALHDGKHLWAHAVATVGQETLIATGGADSNISLINQPALSASKLENRTAANGFDTLDIPTALSSLPNPQALGSGKEIVGRYDFISQNKIVATSSLGRLMLGTFDDGLQWREVEVGDALRTDLKTCYTAKTVGEGAVLLGSTTGNLHHYSETRGVSLVCTVPGKIVNILLLTNPGDAKNASAEVLVHMHGTSDAQHLTLDWSSGAVLATADVRGMDARFVALSAVKIKGGLLVIGSRRGWLSVLKRDEGRFWPVLDLATRTRDAITTLVALPGKGSGGDANAESPYFLATSRDGKYRIYEVEQGDHGGVRLHLRSETAALFGSIIEGGWFTHDASSPELILYGFKSKKLIVWNETRHEELATVECGGSHRTFALMRHPTEPHNIRFGFTKVSQLLVYSQQGSSHRRLKKGTHGREVRTLNSNGRYLATGAEDTIIRIWGHGNTQQQSASECELRCLALMKLHVSGIQQLQWLGDDYLLSSAGMEEFFVWRIQELVGTSYEGLGVACEATFGDRSKDRDLRIMSFDAHKVGPDGGIIITMAMSNSVLQTYRYTSDGAFHLLAKVSYTGACLTQVRHLGVYENGLSALTASTDGHLATWEAKFDHDKPVNHVLVHVAAVHQNGIKSLDLRATPEGFQVVTGGDDNGLGISSLTPSLAEAEHPNYTVSNRGIIRKAHAASINGVALIQRDEETLGVTVSNDQRVKIWRIGSRRTELVADAYSGIADPGDVTLIRETNSERSSELKFVVGGVGVEVWALG